MDGIRLIQAIAPRLPVPDDGHVEAVPERLQIPLEGGQGDFQLLEECLPRDYPPVGEELLDFVEAFGAVHGVHAPVR